MNVTVRRASENDLLAVGQLSMRLTRQHQSYDPRRFVSFENHEAQLFELFRREINSAETIILIAELEGRVVGYAFVRTEEASLIEISARGAWLHDIYVDEQTRGLNVGRRLIDAAVAAARNDLGSRVLMLHVAPQNELARKIFADYGFRTTMLEMTLDV